MQVQLTSDHGLSQLNLGYVTRIPDTKGRKDYRGQGLELRTDQWGAVRAAQGLAITTYARNLAAKHTKDISEAIGILRGAHSQHKSFAELAIDHKADERSIDETAQTQLLNQNHEISGEDHPADIAQSAMNKAKAQMTAPDPKTGASWPIKGNKAEDVKCCVKVHHECSVKVHQIMTCF